MVDYTQRAVDRGILTLDRDIGQAARVLIPPEICRPEPLGRQPINDRKTASRRHRS
jgi:hypothetical protein